ncbi:signal peptidase I [Corynebacterium sp. MSK151]|uniref:signal peptidase I n=1 Tax=unclassified Corynebacterium TaxID=2624378 RepID=UPI0025517FD3|nr:MULTISPECIES: signal peptidase I [unclassified Corynebacterium]MDK8759545.1 signal peptidase I [Corynebacterium sp. MSK151]MDK8848657.1 signal peptidase I [Corynebacterium sp. MSK047]
MTDDDSREQTDGQKEDRTEGLKGFRKLDAEPEKHTPWYIEIPIIIVIALLISAGVQSFIGRVYVIPSESMQPTLNGCVGCTGDRIWVDKVSYQFSDPKPGDVVVFNGPESWNSNYVSQRSSNPVANSLQTVGSWIGLVAPDENALVKRVIATGGQTVQCRPGDPGIMVDGKMTDQDFIKTPADKPVVDNLGSEQCGGPYFGPVTVPEGNLWVMGDNRTNSADSRYHMGDELQGTVPLDNVVGKVQAIILPFNRIGGVDDPDIQHN